MLKPSHAAFMKRAWHRIEVVLALMLLSGCSPGDVKLLCAGRVHEEDRGAAKDFDDLVVDIKRSWEQKSLMFSAYAPKAVFSMKGEDDDHVSFLWEKPEANASGAYVGSLNKRSGTLTIRTKW